jgi:hypothetical protein
MPCSVLACTLFADSLKPSLLIALSFLMTSETDASAFPCQPCCSSYFAMLSVAEFLVQVTVTGTDFLLRSQRACPSSA